MAAKPGRSRRSTSEHLGHPLPLLEAAIYEEGDGVEVEMVVVVVGGGFKLGPGMPQLTKSETINRGNKANKIERNCRQWVLRKKWLHSVMKVESLLI